jgi:hypothetical protein
MPRPLWQLLLEDPSNLTCDECFAVVEYYAKVLTRGGVDLLPRIIEHLARCPDCQLQHRETLRCLVADQSERSAAPLADAIASDGSKVKGQQRYWQERGKSPGEELY